MTLRIDSTSLINGIRNKAQNNVPQTTVTQTDIVSDPIGDMINSESVTTRNMKISDQINKLREKHDVRLNMAKGKITSWNKNTDKLENARSSLADYARSQYIKEAEKDSSMDLSILDKMQDQDIIDWMTKDDPEAQQTYIDFINNGWFVKDAYNKMMWIDEEAIKEQERQDAWWFKNLAWGALFELPWQVWWLMDIIPWVTDYFNNKEKERLDKYNQVTTDEYNKYKNWEISFDELKDKWVSWIYMDYENDVDNWLFRWSVEDYGKAMYDKWIWDTEKTTQEKMQDNFILSYDPESTSSEVGKMIPQMVEFMMLPWASWWFWKNTILWTAEILWIDTLSDWKIPTKWEALTTAWLTAALEAVVKVPWAWKAIRKFIWWTSPEVKEALSKTTQKQWKNVTNVASKWLSETKKEASRYIWKAEKWIKDRLSGIWKELWKSRENLKWDFKFQDVFDAINAEFKKFENKWWGKNSAPEIKIDKAWNMEIYNEDALSNVTDDAWVKILDYIKTEWNAFRNQAREDWIQSAERLMQDIKSKVDKAVMDGKISRWDSAVWAILDWIEWAYENLYKAADLAQKWLWSAFKEQRKQFRRTKVYEDFFNKYVGAIKWGKWWDALLNELKDLEKEVEWGWKAMTKWEDVIWKFFNILRKDKVIKEDLGSQLTSLIYAFALKNPKALQELINTVYPSIPWIRELWLEFWRRWARSAEAKSLLKKWEDKVLNNIDQTSASWKRQVAKKTANKTDKKRWASELNIRERMVKDVEWLSDAINSIKKWSPRAAWRAWITKIDSDSRTDEESDFEF